MATVRSMSARTDCQRRRVGHGLVILVALGIALMHGLTAGHASVHTTVHSDRGLASAHGAMGSAMPAMTGDRADYRIGSSRRDVPNSDAANLFRSGANDPAMEHVACVAVLRTDTQASPPAVIAVAPIGAARTSAAGGSDSGRPARARSPAAQVWELCISRT